MESISTSSLMDKINKEPLKNPRLVLCSFCGKSQVEAKKIIAGPGVQICDACTRVCMKIMEREIPREMPPHAQAKDISHPFPIVKFYVSSGRKWKMLEQRMLASPPDEGSAVTIGLKHYTVCFVEWMIAEFGKGEHTVNVRLKAGHPVLRKG